MRFYKRRNRIGDMEQAIEIGGGKEFAKNFKAFFAAPHSRKPIMNNSDFHLGNKNKKAKGKLQGLPTDVCLLPYDFTSILFTDY